MKKVVSVNLANVGSTGEIARQIRLLGKEKDVICYNAYPWSSMNRKEEENDILIGSKLGKGLSIMAGRITGLNGCFSYFATRSFLKKVDKIKPDIMHFHNLHNCYINLPMLFKYIKKNNIKVVWTLHDCWAFTGQCPHFVMAGCDKWKSGCHNCPQCMEYPSSYVDQTRRMWRLKKKWFTNVKDMILVTPSRWLADLVGQSFLKDYPVQVIHNGINLKTFYPCEGDFRETYNLQNKKVIVGVTMDWGPKKGLDVFIELSKRLDDSYKIVLIGTNDEIDTQIPDNILSIHRTHDQKELAQIYSAADVFVNATREENFPTVNLEALACGTPVVTFKTGGSPESLDDTCAIVVDCDDVDAMEEAVRKVCSTHCFTKEACVKRSRAFDAKDRFEEYLRLYDSL